jgi:hypothetical protein
MSAPTRACDDERAGAAAGGAGGTPPAHRQPPPAEDDDAYERRLKLTPYAREEMEAAYGPAPKGAIERARRSAVASRVS